MTHRQFVAWQEWLAEQDNKPSRVEQVLTLIAERAHGIEIEWKVPEPKAASDPSKSDLPHVLGALGVIAGDFSKIRGGEKMMERIAQLRARGEV